MMERGDIPVLFGKVWAHAFVHWTVSYRRRIANSLFTWAWYWGLSEVVTRRDVS